MLRTHAEGSWFTESGHALGVDWDELGNLDRKMCETAEVAATAGSRCAGYKFFISCATCGVTGNGGAFLAAASARPRSPDRASAATLRTRACMCSAADLVVPREMKVTSLSTHHGHQIGPVFRPEEVQPRFHQVSTVAVRGVDGGSSKEGPTAGHKEEGPWCMMAQRRHAEPVRGQI